MKTIRHILPADDVSLYTFSDEHIGDPNSSLDDIRARIESVKDNDEAYAVLCGDLIDNATVNSIGDTYGAKKTPMEQLELVCGMFEPIKDKILCITGGNHEERTKKEDGIDLTKLIAAQLGIGEVFSSESVLMFLRFGEADKGRRRCYTVFCNHGTGGGRKVGGKANRLADMANIVDADVYIHAHTHTPMVFRQSYYRTNYGNSSVKLVDKLFVNTASNLKYGGYGDAKEYTPSSRKTPVIWMCGRERIVRATL